MKEERIELSARERERADPQPAGSRIYSQVSVGWFAWGPTAVG
jgi:hypothetical protein